MDLSRAFEILEIDETASFSEIKQAYRDLASVWHPDLHSQNSRLSEKVLQKMKELNAAYDLLSSYYSERTTHKARSSHYDEQEVTVIKCKECGSLNRIPNLTGVTFKCGKCQSNLFSEKQYNEDAERVLCADGECIGIIRNGRCSVCGKTLEAGKQENERKTKIYQEFFREKEKKKLKKQKRNKVVKYSLFAAFVIIIGYGVYQDSSNTGKKQHLRHSSQLKLIKYFRKGLSIRTGFNSIKQILTIAFME